MKKEILRMERITYRERGLTKLEDFNLYLYEGEILGFLAVNMHGRRSFLRLLQKNLPLYDGYVYYNEKLVNSWKGSSAEFNRITIIQDTSSLVEDLTVADNIFVLRRGFRQQIISSSVLKRQLDSFLAEIHLNLPADTVVYKLSTFERIVVELLKGIVAGHRLIVMDDVANLITGHELAKLHAIIRYYATQGTSFLYIASHFEDLMHICNKTALLVNGRIVKTLNKEEFDTENIATITRDYTSRVRDKLEQTHGDHAQIAPICNLDFHFKNAQKTTSLYVKKGECLVVQCLHNDMYLELAHAVKNQTLPPDSKLVLRGKSARNLQNRQLAIVQEYASRTMIFSEMTYMDNLCFSLDTRIKSVWRAGAIQRSLRTEMAEKLGNVFDLSIDELSERQKIQLVYTRILLQKPEVVICMQPFKGADIDLRMFIWELLEELIAQGIAVILLVVNLADSLAIGDRLVRIEGLDTVQEYSRTEFSQIPVIAPWKHLYE